mmetsp:Transcript_1726/g.3354  ORF Transcript_1726/g.3354 Transcript_1726/m.3354 type:complete len:104 (+) Transcript_1726:2056-2367(+)
MRFEPLIKRVMSASSAVCIRMTDPVGCIFLHLLFSSGWQRWPIDATLNAGRICAWQWLKRPGVTQRGLSDRRMTNVNKTNTLDEQKSKQSGSKALATKKNGYK